MDTFNQVDLKQLIDATGQWCISLYMPTHPVGWEQQENPIRLRNLLARARKDLLAYGLRRPDAESLLAPAEALLLDSVFWQHQGNGLAVFLSNNFSRTYRLPIRFDELLVVAHHFHIRPVLPLLGTDRKFYILALNLNGIRLFLATRDTIDEIELKGISTNIEEALWMDEEEPFMTFHTSTGDITKSGERLAVFYGHFIGDEEKTDILRFFNYFDHKLNDFLEDKSIPMLLAGVDYLLPIYRQANSYDNLLPEALVGAPEKLPLKELHKRAWQIIEPIFQARKRQAIEQFNELHGRPNGLTTTDLERAVNAARFGLVATLFVPLGVQKWGRYDAGNNKVSLERKPGPDNVDLLDFAAIHTLLNGGQVYSLEPEEIPGGGDLAAILRFAA